jgi:small subunit ribosomal protein S20
MSIANGLSALGLFSARLTLVGTLAIEQPDHSLMFPALSRPSHGEARSKDQSMANTKSAKKAARQTIRRTAVNKARRARFRSSVRKVEEALASGNKEAAAAALKEAEPIIARIGQKGVVHRKMASRKVSRLSKRVGAIGTP